MEIHQFKNGGTQIDLDGDEVAIAIDAWLVAHSVVVSGPRTISVNDELITHGSVFVDRSGFVIDRREEEKIYGNHK